jgi:Fur family ferric uptake transcriptional regulator
MTKTVTLKSYNLRHTECREVVLYTLASSKSALSHGDLEQAVDDKFDRVTIYRTLKTFLEKGIIHKILDGQGGTKYALCESANCTSDTHQHDHVHFKCKLCGDTTCINSVDIPTIHLPKGYQREEINLLIEGSCPNCQ